MGGLFSGREWSEPVHPSLWSPPPSGAFKPNFNGSFLKDVRRDGGLIKDSMGNSLCTYSGPVVVSESNEVEAYAMLVECCQLKSLDGYNALEKGILFLRFNGDPVKRLIPGEWQIRLKRFGVFLLS